MVSFAASCAPRLNWRDRIGSEGTTRARCALAMVAVWSLLAPSTTMTSSAPAAYAESTAAAIDASSLRAAMTTETPDGTASDGNSRHNAIPIRTRHYSIRTEEAYVTWARRYILFHKKKHPSAMGAEEINAFLTHLAVERNVSASTQNQALSALLFLYKEILQENVGWIGDVVRATRPKRLPVVFTREEVVQILGRMAGTERLLGELLYGTGMRVMESVRLRVKDLDFATGAILVREGKGQKDRITYCHAHDRDAPGYLRDSASGMYTAPIPPATSRS